MSTTQVLSLTTKTLAYCVATLFAGTILVTYTLCIHEGECPKLPHLPTISGTWITPPGNYLSRWSVNVGCTALMIGNLIMYWINEKRRPSNAAKFPSNGSLLGMSQFAVFCLSWVGAICDSSEPSCNGNGHIHTTFAVTFFIIYDLYLILILHMPTSTPLQHRGCLTLAVAWSVFSKLRWSSAINHLLHDETPLAIVEWTDVMAIMYFIVRFLTDNGQPFVSGIVVVNPSQLPSKMAEVKKVDGSSVKVLSSATSDRVLLFCGIMATGTLLTTWMSAVHEGVVPKHTLPDVSSIWIKKPADFFARWGMMLVSSSLSTVHVLFFFMRATRWGERSMEVAKQASLFVPKLIMAVGVASAVFAGLMGIIDEAENAKAHRFASDSFFTLSTIYMIVSVLDTLIASPSLGCRFVIQNLAMLVSVAAKLRFCCVSRMISEHVFEKFSSPEAQAKAEWSDIIALFVFTSVTIVLQPNKLGQRVMVAITTTD